VHLAVLTFFTLIVIAYLSGFFAQYKKPDLGYNKENMTLIEFLTQHKTKSKDYSRIPEGFSSYNKQLNGKRLNDSAFFRYEYPLIEKYTGIFETTLHPKNVSTQVDYFGLQSSLILKSENGYKLNNSLPESNFIANMNQDGWYFKSFSDSGVDYKYLVQKYAEFSISISQQIQKELTDKELDTYFNRVQATLNFVQFIPYGQPDFSTNEWYYHGLGVPPESFILGYGDCDSKSIFFASILLNLIPSENIVLVSCLVKSGDDKTDGAHMMAAVSDLEIEGEMVNLGDKKYLLLETTAPSEIGAFNWESFKATDVIGLA
jgi:hypothetical protein